jgi:hypothetical protein
MSKTFGLSLSRAFRIAYAIGIGMCVCCPTILQLNLDKIITPILGISKETVQNIGYTFTGLVLICILAITLRWRKICSEFSNIAENKKSTVLLRETLFFSAITTLSSFLGAIYYLLGGITVKQFARNFITLTPVMFFIFIPRLNAWKKASKKQ